MHNNRNGDSDRLGQIFAFQVYCKVSRDNYSPLHVRLAYAGKTASGGWRRGDSGRMTESVKTEDLLTLTAKIVAAHVSNNSVALGDLPGLIH